MVGEVQNSVSTCMLCPAATYSLLPTNTSCDAPCPANAECHGGAILVPDLGYWHSAAASTYMVQCPNSNACSGARDLLVTCQGDAYATPSITGQTQVHMHTEMIGTLAVTRTLVSIPRSCQMLLYSKVCCHCDTRCDAHNHGCCHRLL